MTDTEMLDWFHLYGFAYRYFDGSYELLWSSKTGMRVTQGIDLRDCIRGAVIESMSVNQDK